MSFEKLSDRLVVDFNKLRQNTQSQIDALRVQQKTLQYKLAAIEWEISTSKKVTSIIDGLRRCYRPRNMSQSYDLWLFCKSYAVSPDGKKLTSLNCLIVPEMVLPDNAVRSKPNAEGSCVTEPEIGRRDKLIDAAINLAPSCISRVSVDDILTEPCDQCGKMAIVAANEFGDGGEEGLYLALWRFCPHCTRIKDIIRVFDKKGMPL